MADVSTVRAEIKAWERAFKSEHQRSPTVEDIRSHPDIEAKYKLFKKLSKAITAKGDHGTGNQMRRTPPQSYASSSQSISILPKAPATHSTIPSDANPFSPTKHSRKKNFGSHSMSSTRSSPRGDSPTPNSVEMGMELSSQLPEPYTVAEPARNHPGFEANAGLSGVNRARKRLRGDPVSPSPNKPKKARKSDNDHRRMLSQDAMSDTREHTEVDSSFLADSPIKLSGGKDFKSLFDEDQLNEVPTGEGQKPPRRLLFPGISAPSTYIPSHTVKMPTNSKQSLNPEPEKEDKSRSRQMLSFRRTGNTMDTASDHESQIQPSKDIRTSENRSQQDHMPNGKATSGEGTTLGYNLLPPSPKAGAKRLLDKVKNASWNRKKAKIPLVDDVEQDRSDTQDDLYVVDLDMQEVRRDRLHGKRLVDGETGVDDEEELLDGDLLVTACYGRRATISTADTLEVEDQMAEINLPDDMRKYLHISSSQARERDELDVAADVLQGRRRGTKIARGEVWGVGEGDDEGAPNTDGDDDWVGDGVPWEAAELSDVEGGV